MVPPFDSYRSPKIPFDAYKVQEGGSREIVPKG